MLDVNPYNGYYMTDLGYLLSEKAEISITYKDKTIFLENISKEFVVSSEEALKIGSSTLKDKIKEYKENTTGIDLTQIINTYNSKLSSTTKPDATTNVNELIKQISSREKPKD